MSKPLIAIPPVTEATMSAANFIVCMACDIAGRLLCDIANQMTNVKEFGSATMFNHLAQDLAKYRDGYLERMRGQVKLASVADLPQKVEH